MSNDHIKSEISAYLSGGLPEARLRQMDAHMAICEKCRQALNKARAKQARVKREALKKASPDPLPNLFLARQGKDAGVDRPSSRSPWGLLMGVVLAGVVYGLYRHFSPGFRAPETPAVTSDPSLANVNIAPIVSSAPAAPVAAPVPAVPVVPAPPAPVPVAFEVKQEWKGAESGIKTSRIAVIRSWKAWDRLWAEMQEKEPLPAVNFDQYVVVCVFGGGRTPNASVQLGRIHEHNGELIIPYSVSGSAAAVSVSPVVVSTPAVGASSSSIVASSATVVPATSVMVAQSHPYLLSMIPRSDKKLRVTQREIP